MKYEKNKDAYQDEAWFERERNVLDVLTINLILWVRLFIKLVTTTKTNTEQSSSSGIYLLSH